MNWSVFILAYKLSAVYKCSSTGLVPVWKSYMWWLSGFIIGTRPPVSFETTGWTVCDCSDWTVWICCPIVTSAGNVNVVVPYAWFRSVVIIVALIGTGSYLSVALGTPALEVSRFLFGPRTFRVWGDLPWEWYFSMCFVWLVLQMNLDGQYLQPYGFSIPWSNTFYSFGKPTYW